MIKKYVATLRPRHWIKNVFILAPAFFALKLGDSRLIMEHLIVFIQFSLIAGAAYTFNDILDYNQDVNNPKKMNRPIINGSLSKKNGFIFFVVLTVIVFCSAAFFNMAIFYVLFIYWLLNIFYSLKLKRLVIIDVFILAFGFILRILAGSILIQIDLSQWIVNATFLIALFLGFAKRRAEIKNLKQDAQNPRNVLKQYSIPLLDNVNSIIVGLIIINYIFYCISADIISKYQTSHLSYTVIFVLYGFLRYFYLIHIEDKCDNPTDIFFTDKPTMINILLWIIAFLTIVTLKL